MTDTYEDRSGGIRLFAVDLVAGASEIRNKRGAVTRAARPPYAHVKVGVGIGPHLTHEPDALRRWARILNAAAEDLDQALALFGDGVLIPELPGDIS